MFPWPRVGRVSEVLPSRPTLKVVFCIITKKPIFFCTSGLVKPIFGSPVLSYTSMYFTQHWCPVVRNLNESLAQNLGKTCPFATICEFGKFRQQSLTLGPYIFWCWENPEWTLWPSESTINTSMCVCGVVWCGVYVCVCFNITVTMLVWMCELTILWHCSYNMCLVSIFFPLPPRVSRWTAQEMLTSKTRYSL